MLRRIVSAPIHLTRHWSLSYVFTELISYTVLCCGPQSMPSSFKQEHGPPLTKVSAELVKKRGLETRCFLFGVSGICMGCTDAEFRNIFLERLFNNHNVSCSFLSWEFYLSQGPHVPTTESWKAPLCLGVSLKHVWCKFLCTEWERCSKASWRM